jgi:hypothetical protein
MSLTCLTLQSLSGGVGEVSIAATQKTRPDVAKSFSTQ